MCAFNIFTHYSQITLTAELQSANGAYEPYIKTMMEQLTAECKLHVMQFTF